MDSGQLPEPDPPEPPDPPSSLVRSSFSHRSFCPLKLFTFCNSHFTKGVSISEITIISAGFSIFSQFLLPESSSESLLWLDLNLRCFQTSLHSAPEALWPSILSEFSSLRSSSRVISVASLVLGLGSSSDLITAVVASCTGTTSYAGPYPSIQVLDLRFSNLITCDVLISMVCSLGLLSGLLLASLRPFTAVCSLFTAVCSFTLCTFKFICDLLWQFDGFMSNMSILRVNVIWLDINYLFSYSLEFVLLAISLSTSSGFGAWSKMLKIKYTSVTEVLIKGSSKGCLIAYACVAISKIVNCALAAVSISGFISLIVVDNFQGFPSLCSLVVESRGPLYAISCSSVWFAPIFICLIVIVCLARVAFLSCNMNLFSFNGE